MTNQAIEGEFKKSIQEIETSVLIFDNLLACGSGADYFGVHRVAYRCYCQLRDMYLDQMPAFNLKVRMEIDTALDSLAQAVHTIMAIPANEDPQLLTDVPKYRASMDIALESIQEALSLFVNEGLKVVGGEG